MTGLHHVRVLIPMLGRAHLVGPLVETLRAYSHAPVLFLCSPNDRDAIVACNQTGEDVLVVDWQPGRGDDAAKINLGYRETTEPWVFTGRTGRRYTRPTLAHTWHPVRALAGRPQMDFYELRHFCATHLLELGVSHADVAVQLGHTDGGALVMSTYGHPSEDLARERLKRAYTQAVTPLRMAEGGSQEGRKAV